MRTLLLLALVLLPAAAFADDCSAVTAIEDSSDTASGLRAALALFNKDVQNPHFRQISMSGAWLEAETTFDNADPGIFIFKHQGNGYAVVNAFGGAITPKEGDPHMVIATYFAGAVPQAPRALLACFMPKGAPFVPGVK